MCAQNAGVLGQWPGCSEAASEAPRNRHTRLSLLRSREKRGGSGETQPWLREDQVLARIPSNNTSLRAGHDAKHPYHRSIRSKVSVVPSRRPPAIADVAPLRRLGQEFCNDPPLMISIPRHFAEKKNVSALGQLAPRYYDAVRQFKRLLLIETLIAYRGNRTHAARALGLRRTYLLRLMGEYGICVPRSANQIKRGKKRTHDAISNGTAGGPQHAQTFPKRAQDGKVKQR